ncbi:MAG TPA: flagellin biosynthesis protein FlgN [Lachnospiraceae bacterium]|nr:flagellin biosynthesis protein FlgN [Lachnospiraceae bacterium]
MDNNSTYIEVMIQSLNKKKEVLEKIIDYTIEQELVLSENEVDLDKFGDLINDKQKWIEQLNLLDTGFEKLFERVKEEFQLHREMYQEEIVEMQQLIKKITDLGVILQTSELRNKVRFEQYSAYKKKEIRAFKMSNTSASKYYNNMANQHQGQSYFLDKKK